MANKKLGFQRGVTRNALPDRNGNGNFETLLHDDFEIWSKNPTFPTPLRAKLPFSVPESSNVGYYQPFRLLKGLEVAFCYSKFLE